MASFISNCHILVCIKLIEGFLQKAKITTILHTGTLKIKVFLALNDKRKEKKNAEESKYETLLYFGN